MSLPDGVWQVIDELKGRLGDGDSEVIRNIVISYLSERGILVPRYDAKASVSGSRDISEATFRALIEALVDQKLITYADLEKRIKRKIGAGTDLTVRK